ncbi:sarcosine oxidase subunit gamma [Amphibiibacter pelophylacis]|uniref:Sarcosine oxidase subunit gamma family protein n=1 Tax=Amphibiibacter pelophylacis TaxID=1799477 RepID=A0ACC6P563_9BURK
MPDPTDLTAAWQTCAAILNLRGNPDDAAFRDGVRQALGADLPVAACSANLDAGAQAGLRLIWAGPDDWFVLSRYDTAAALELRLRQALAGQHVAVTDVSGGYTVLELAGAGARELLAQGCPLDLHPRQFRVGQSAGSVFFKASVWLWQTQDEPRFEVLVRNSFRGYVALLIERCSAGAVRVRPPAITPAAALETLP